LSPSRFDEIIEKKSSRKLQLDYERAGRGKECAEGFNEFPDMNKEKRAKSICSTFERKKEDKIYQRAFALPPVLSEKAMEL